MFFFSAGLFFGAERVSAGQRFAVMKLLKNMLLRKRCTHRRQDNDIILYDDISFNCCISRVVASCNSIQRLRHLDVTRLLRYIEKRVLLQQKKKKKKKTPTNKTEVQFLCSNIT